MSEELDYEEDAGHSASDSEADRQSPSVSHGAKQNLGTQPGQSANGSSSSQQSLDRDDCIFQELSKSRE